MREGPGGGSARAAGSASAHSRHATNTLSVRCMTFVHAGGRTREGPGGSSARAVGSARVHSRDSTNTDVFVACLLCTLARMYVRRVRRVCAACVCARKDTGGDRVTEPEACAVGSASMHKRHITNTLHVRCMPTVHAGARRTRLYAVLE